MSVPVAGSQFGFLLRTESLRTVGRVGLAMRWDLAVVRDIECENGLGAQESWSLVTVGRVEV